MLRSPLTVHIIEHLREHTLLATAPKALFLITFTAIACSVHAAPPTDGDWPQFRGPGRDLICSETGLLDHWPDDGPPLLWMSEGLGTGNSTPSLSRDRIFGMSYRGPDEVVWALDAANGEEIWAARIADANRGIGEEARDGSGSTPTIDGDRLYALGISGDLVCLDVTTGDLKWQKNLVADFGGRIPYWGYCESLLVDGPKVVATPGGAAATLVALDKRNGRVIWKAPVPEGDVASYASMIIAEPAGVRQYIQFVAKGVVGIRAEDGKYLWRENSSINQSDIHCSTPVYHDSYVFTASNYGTGGALIRLVAESDGWAAELQYTTRNMKSHHGGFFYWKCHLYGTDESILTCLDFRSGKVLWENRSVGKGAVVLADGHLYLRSENGPVALVEATPHGYHEKGRFNQPHRSGKPTWPYPVIAAGRLYLRDQDILLCYDLRK